MTPDQIAINLKSFLNDSYPNMQVEAKPWSEDPSRLAVYYREAKFALLYPLQRYHYLVHSIPTEFFNAYLQSSVWFELAPGEEVEDLQYPDEEFLASIAPDVLSVVEKMGVYSGLDDLLAPELEGSTPEECHGDFRHLKRVLQEKGFGVRGEIDEIFDVCHVIMSAGGYCDCEVLYNVAESNRLKERYWKDRAKHGRH